MIDDKEAKKVGKAKWAVLVAAACVVLAVGAVTWALLKPGLVTVHIGLALVAFLAVFNGYLRGAWKAQIDAGIGLLWLTLLAVAFVALGWRAALWAVGLSFVYGAIVKPFARALARWGLRV